MSFVPIAQISCSSVTFVKQFLLDIIVVGSSDSSHLLLGSLGSCLPGFQTLLILGLSLESDHQYTVSVAIG
jgi:hypothetical protein